MIRYAGLLFALAGLTGCQLECDDPGAICTVAGTGRAGLGLERTCAADAMLYWPSDVTVGPDDNPWIVDWNNHRIMTVDMNDSECPRLLHVTGNGMVGDGPMDGPASTALWNHPAGILFDDPESTSFVMAAWHNSRIVRIDPEADTIEWLAGSGARGFTGDGGPPQQAAFDLPAGVQWGMDGRLYIADEANQRVRCIDTDDTVKTVVGNGIPDFSGDGGNALEASLQGQVSQNADPGGRIAIEGDLMYIADTLNNRIRIVDMTTWTIDTLAGDGSEGGPETGDPLTSGLYWPRDVEVAPDGSIYVADSENHCVRRIDGDTIETVAGVCGKMGFRGDNGPATNALLGRPYGIDVGPDGTLWIADTWNHRIRKVAPVE